MPRLAGALASLLAGSSWAIFAAAALLAWRFRRPGMALGTAVLTLAGAAGWAAAAGAVGAPGVVPEALGLLVPLDLALLGLLDPWLRSPRRVGVTVVVLGGQALAVGVLAWSPAAPIVALLGASPFVPGLPPRLGGLSQTALAGGLIAFAIAAAAFVRRASPIDAGAAWAIVAVLAALASGVGSVHATAWLAAAGVVVVIALVEVSRDLVYLDPLTGLPARRALDADVARLGRRYAIAMVDVDHFKRFNDTYGHAAGDQLLRRVAAQLATVPSGTAYRYGGEEFAILFPGRRVDEVLPVLEKLREGIEAAPFTVRGADRPARKPERSRANGAHRQRVTVTVSIGVAGSTERRRRAPAAVIEAADAALYRAKRAGRNRVAR